MVVLVQTDGVPPQAQPVEMRHDGVQPSLPTLLPSSQSSPSSTMPLPQTKAGETLLQTEGAPMQL